MKYYPLAVIFCLSIAHCQSDISPKKVSSSSAPSQAVEQVSEKPKAVESSVAPITESWTLSAYVSPEKVQSLKLASKQWTKFKIVKVLPAGSKVKKGETIIELEEKGLREDIKKRQDNLAVQKATIEQKRNSYNRNLKLMASDLEAASLKELRAKQALADYVEGGKENLILSANERLENYNYAIEYLTVELDQLEKMYKEDDLTQESEEFILARKRRQLKKKKLFLKVVEHNLKVELTRTIPDKLVSLKRKLLEKSQYKLKKKEDWAIWQLKEDIALKKLDLSFKAAQEKLKEAEADLEFCSIKADFDGVLYYGESVDGKWLYDNTFRDIVKRKKSLSSNWVFATLVDESQLAVTALYDESHINKVQKGLDVEISTAIDKKDSASGKILLHSNVPVKAHFYRMKASFDNEKIPYLKPGMRAKVKVINYHNATATQIPQSYLKESDGRSFVYVKSDEGIVEQDVVAGVKEGRMIEIKDGLLPSTKIYLKK